MTSSRGNTDDGRATRDEGSAREHGDREHGRGHQHHDHTHDVAGVSDRALGWTVALNVGLSVFEFAAGVISGSVALMADALHNSNDAAALLVALIARRISRRGADAYYTFGYKRAELIGAMIQLTALIIVGLFLLQEAVTRFFRPEPIEGAWMMIASGVALVVDLLTVWLLWALAKGSLNLRAAFLHNLTDAAASVAVLAGGAAIHWLGWVWVDPALTLVLAGYMLGISVNLLRRTSRILMEGKPDDVDVHEILRSIEAVEGVLGAHHIHVWELDEEHRALEAHIVVEDDRMADVDRLKTRVKALLEERFRIAHSTLEFEGLAHACVQCVVTGAHADHEHH